MLPKFFLKPEELSNNQKEELAENILDEGLIWNKFKRGDKNAYKFIYDKYFDLLFRYGNKIDNDKERVKDSIHDLYIELWKNKENLGEPASIKNYLIKSLRRKLYRISYKNQFVFKLENYENYHYGFTFSHENEIIEEQTQQEVGRKLTHGLNSLTKRQREAICLIYYDNLSYKEVAGIMSLKIRTVYNMVFNAIQILKKEIPYLNSISLTIATGYAIFPL